jgi:hypothetical protein
MHQNSACKRPEKIETGPIGIVSGIGDELIVEGKRCPFVEAVGVIGFEDLLRTIVERVANGGPGNGAPCFSRFVEGFQQ